MKKFQKVVNFSIWAISRICNLEDSENLHFGKFEKFKKMFNLKNYKNFKDKKISNFENYKKLER